ncbi:MAG: methyltransferase domain-containing protein [Thermoleophilia bacterium]
MSGFPDGYDLVTDTVDVAGAAYRITHPRQAEELIDEDEYALDERLPYWADLWPSGIMLARCLASHPVRGLRVLEVGAGLGLPSLVALRAGADVLAMDWYGEALRFAAANARDNGIAGLRTIEADWGEPPPALLAETPFDLVVGADVAYENRHGPQLAALILRLVRPDGTVLIADPRRPAASSLVTEMREAGWRHVREEVRYDGRPDEQGRVIYLHRFSEPPRGSSAGGTRPIR